MDETLYTKALRFLSLRPRSEKEVRDYLMRKLTTNSENLQAEIDLVLNRLQSQNFINDRDFSEWWIEQRNKFNPKGWKIIEAELKQKGIGAEIIKELELAGKELRKSDEVKAVTELINKKVKQFKSLTKTELINKISAFLYRKGFAQDIIKSCIDEILRK